MSAPAPTIHPVVLCGGSGSRLWPLSRAERPKQFLALLNERSLLQNTLLRFRSDTGFAPPLVVGSAEHRHLVEGQARECQVELSGIIVEPAARDTAFAIAAAAFHLVQKDPDALMLVAPADHVVEPAAALAAAVHMARRAAQDGWLVTFGVPPTRPETGYGYVEVSDEAVAEGVCRASSFVEKPKLELALKLLEGGRHCWNSGIFFFRAATLVSELRSHAPEVCAAAEQSVAGRTSEGPFVFIDAAPLETLKPISIDYALMQVSDRVAVMPLFGIGWSDIGNWHTLHELSPQDERGNATFGQSILSDAENVLTHLTDGRTLVAMSVSNLMIISTPDVLLVAHRSASQDLKQIVDLLRRDRPELLMSPC